MEYERIPKREKHACQKQPGINLSYVWCPDTQLAVCTGPDKIPVVYQAVYVYFSTADGTAPNRHPPSAIALVELPDMLKVDLVLRRARKLYPFEDAATCVGA